MSWIVQRAASAKRPVKDGSALKRWHDDADGRERHLPPSLPPWLSPDRRAFAVIKKRLGSADTVYGRLYSLWPQKPPRGLRQRYSEVGAISTMHDMEQTLGARSRVPLESEQLRVIVP